MFMSDRLSKLLDFPFFTIYNVLTGVVAPSTFNVDMLMNEELVKLTFYKFYKLYSLYFSCDINSCTFYNEPENEMAPITFRKKNEIILNFSDFNQFVFQLSHELCHWMIPEDVADKLRWIEETFAVAASIVFPSMISDIDNFHYQKYAKEILNCITPLCVMCPGIPNKKEILIMEVGSGTSNYNDYGSYWNIAQALIPVITKNPVIWKALPYLCQLSVKKTSIEALQEWKDVCPLLVKDSVSEITSILIT